MVGVRQRSDRVNEVNLPGVSFQPWRGEYYGVPGLFGIPILIVGESHHGFPHEADDQQFTRSCIQQIEDGTWRHRFFSNIASSFLGGVVSGEPACRLWPSVAFYNYVQDLLPGPGEAPTEAMWSKAHPAFGTVLERLLPACILFVCRRLFDQVKTMYPAAPSLYVDGRERETISVPLPRGDTALSSYILHPTYRGWRRQAPWVRSLVETAGGRIP
jgi:hypothetical protein